MRTDQYVHHMSLSRLIHPLYVNQGNLLVTRPRSLALPVLSAPHAEVRTYVRFTDYYSVYALSMQYLQGGRGEMNASKEGERGA